MAEAGALDLVAAGAILEQPRNRSPSARWPMRRMPLGVSSMRPSRCSMRPASSSMLRELGELLQRTGRVVAEEVAHAVEVDLGELTRVGRVAHQVLERVDVAELVEQRAHALERERLVAAEAHPLAPTHLRERVAQVLTELVHLPAEIHVVEQRVRRAPGAARAARGSSS